jgi:predicted neuraminidase
VDVLKLPDGRWLMMNNDTERGRHSLVLALSDDEGASWKWRRHIELDARTEKADSYHYPSLCLSADGTVHATYSVFRNEVPEGRPRKTIRYARFQAEWVMQGDSR